MTGGRRAAALLAVGALSLAACRRSAPPGPFPAAPIVLVSVDTLRADRLGLYGYAQATTPVLDALARESVVFEDAVSHVPLTLPAHASMMTGLLPTRHGVRDNIGFTLRPEHKTLATRFREAGRPTGGAVSAYVLRASTGIATGFDSYDDALEIDAASESLGDQQRDGAVSVESLLRFIESHKERPFFAFLHLYEPHTPYTPPERHRGHAHSYDGEVAYTDELVGRLLERLRGLGLYDKAILAVTADHGEGLSDHGEAEHGFFLYREAVRVPLLLRLPGAARAGVRVSGPVGQVDLPVTLLDLVGLSAARVDGVSQRAALGGATVPGRPIYSETLFPRLHFGWSELRSVAKDRFRYIHAPRPELFDVREDPGERRNLVAERGSAVASMRSWLEAHADLGATPAREKVSPEVQERLQALGYVGSGAVTTAAGPLPDPKDKIGIHENYKRALALRQEGKDAEAVEGLRKVLADSPGMLDVWETLGLTLARMGQEQAGLEALGRVVTADPTRASTHLALARIHAIAGRSTLVAQHAELASTHEPGRAYEMLAELMLQRNRLPEAEAYARKSLAVDRERVMSHYTLGVAARRTGRCEEALAAYRNALAVQQRQKRLVVRDLHSGMADCLARLGREAEAEQEFRTEIAEIPYSREGRVGLAILYRSQGRDADAREVLSGVVTANPRASADEYWTVVRTFTVLGDRQAAAEWASRGRSQFPKDRRFGGSAGG